ncbi:MAG: negative regulator for alginate biosynthesis, partial [Halioglobus sp.]|nr:negative regulator for alginate biosynthesis [Halioglobus sp.]
MNRCYAVGLLWLLLAAGAAASACPDVDQRALHWLNKMSHSLCEISYQGVVTLQRGTDLQVVQVTHSVDDDARSESMTELTGSGARVQRVSHPLECVEPGIRRLRMVAHDNVPCGIGAQYRVNVMDGERVAGRNAVRLSITPKDVYRFGHVLTLDKETGLLLKAITLNHAHKMVEVMQFAQVSFADPLPQGAIAGRVHEVGHSTG